jgi:hypothetical protein
VMEHATNIGNRLFAALPPDDFALLAPHLRKVSLERDAVLIRSGDRIEHLLFPCSGAIAFLMTCRTGRRLPPPWSAMTAPLA